VLVVVGEVSYQLLSRIKVSICREHASSLKPKAGGLFSKEREIVKNVVISWEQVVLMWWMSNDESKEVDGDQSGPRAGTEWPMVGLNLRFVGMASLCVIVMWCGSCWYKITRWVERRYEARVEEGCVRRSSRGYESRVETMAVLPGAGGGSGA
jgi:hypothetical protein